MKYELYTDGSHLKGSTDRLGIGGVLVQNNRVIDSFSMEIDRNDFKSYYKTDDVSNPTMEMLAVLVGLSRYAGNFTNNDIIEVFSDYKGVSEWMTGKWRTTKPYILKIKTEILTIVYQNHLNVTYSWVKGHAGNQYNEMADRLANPR